MADLSSQCDDGLSCKSSNDSVSLRKRENLPETNDVGKGPNRDKCPSDCASNSNSNGDDEVELKRPMLNGSKTEPEAVRSRQLELTFGRWAVFVCAMFNFGLAISMPVAMSSMFLDWQDSFHVSRAHTVAVHSTAVGIVFGGAIIPGYLTNRFGARFTVLLGTFLASLGCLLSCFATSINYLIATVGVIGGLGFCFMQLPALPAATAAFKGYEGIVASLCTFLCSCLNMSLHYLYRLLVNRYSWRGAFAFISGIAMQSAITGIIMTSHSKQSSRDVDTKDKELEATLLAQEYQIEIGEPKNGGINESHDDDEEELKDLVGEEKSKIALTAVNNNVYSSSPQSISSHLHRIGSCVSRLKKSKWRFLVDYWCYLIILHIGACLAAQYSFVFSIMDFAKTKGFAEDTGTLFAVIIFGSGLVGRLSMMLLYLVPHLHSVIIMGLYGAVASVGMIMLGSATDYNTILGFLMVQGFGTGAIVAAYPKCVYDLKSVDARNYPLALGLACTMEGIFDLVLPVLTGYAVDTTGSYTLILHLMGTVALTVSIVLVLNKTFTSCQEYRRTKSITSDDIL